MIQQKFVLEMMIGQRHHLYRNYFKFYLLQEDDECSDIKPDLDAFPENQ